MRLRSKATYRHGDGWLWWTRRWRGQVMVSSNSPPAQTSGSAQYPFPPPDSVWYSTNRDSANAFQERSGRTPDRWTYLPALVGIDSLPHACWEHWQISS